MRTDIHKIIGITELCQSIFAPLQRTLQGIQLLVDKSNGLIGNLVLFLQILSQIDFCQLIDKVAVTLRCLTSEREPQHRTAVHHEIVTHTALELVNQTISCTESEIDLPGLADMLAGPKSGREIGRFYPFTIVNIGLIRTLLIRGVDMHHTISLECNLKEQTFHRLLDIFRLNDNRRIAIEIARLETPLRIVVHLQERYGIHHAR